MKAKRVLKFYFCAEGLNAALDNLIMKRALASAQKYYCVEDSALSVISVIEAKEKLSQLYCYLDKVMSVFGEEEKRVLRFYGCTRKKVTDDCRREVRRVTVRFFRHATRLKRFSAALRLVDGYYCLLSERRK